MLQTLFPPTPLPIATGHSSGVRPWEQLAGERGLLGRGLTAPSSNKEPALARRLLPSPYGRRGPAWGGVTAGPTCSAHTHAGRGAPLLLQAGAGGRGTAAWLLFLQLAAKDRQPGEEEAAASSRLLLGERSAARLEGAAGIVKMQAHTVMHLPGG